MIIIYLLLNMGIFIYRPMGKYLYHAMGKHTYHTMGKSTCYLQLLLYTILSVSSIEIKDELIT